MDTHQLNLEQCVGQRLMIGFEGTQLNDRLKYNIGQRKVGGLILFSRNIESPGQVERLCRAAQEYARQCGQPPLLIAIDQEGGSVARLKPPFTQFPGAAHIQDTAAAAQFAAITARELRSIGVNMDMAPVLDVLPEAGPSVMRDRSFGRDPQRVANLGGTVIDGLQRDGILAVAKHFPGIGRTVLDSHDDLPDLAAGRTDLMARDVLPFEEAINRNVAGIMLSHIRYLDLDPRWPASLSPRIAHDLLRLEMHYTGLVLTDDFDMGAIAKHYAPADIVRQCLDAAIDILLICHESPKIDQFIDLMLVAHQHQATHAETMRASIERILEVKQAMPVDPAAQ